MHYKLTLLFLVFIGCLGLRAEDAENVVISEVQEVYKFKSDKTGKPESVKNSLKRTYLAKGYDDNAVAYAAYGDNISIDKASAPGAKPHYSQVIGEGIFYEDHRLCLMPMTLKAGKPVTAEVERTFRDPAQVCEISFLSPYDIDKYHLTVEVPQVLAEKLVLMPVNFPDDAEISREVLTDRSVIYHYRLHDIKKVCQEPQAPSPSLCSPRIFITGYFDGVQGLYSHLKSYVEAEEASPEVEALSASLTSGLSDALDKIDAIARWVRQNIRYVAIEHGEYGNRPARAAEVLDNRYGDCKGSANLIKALLQAAGLDGRLVWIGTRDEINTRWEDYPMMASGNHMIAACVLPDSIVYIDGTTDYSPSRYISAYIRGQSALIENGDTYMLATVPSMPLDVDTDSISATYALDGDYRLSGDLTHLLSGLFARMYDGMYHNLSAERRDKLLYALARNGRNSVEVTDPQFVREAPDSPTATFTAKVSDPSAVKMAGGKALVSVPLFDLDDLVVYDAEKRVNPIYLSAASRSVAEVTVDLGDHAPRLDMPVSTEVDNPWFGASVTYDLDGSVLHISAELWNKRTEASLAEIPDWNKAVRQTKRALSPVLKFRLPQ